MNLTTVYWISPIRCMPPHQITHWDKYDELVKLFREHGGFSINHQPLIGYSRDDDTIQLLTGSHRWAACRTTDCPVPVLFQQADDLEKIFGTDEWVHLCNFSWPIRTLNWVETTEPYILPPEWGYGAYDAPLATTP